MFIAIAKIAVLLFIVLTVNAYLTWFERKVVAHIQSRWGPYRVGPHGLLQPLADGVKFFFKEDPTPAGVDRFVYYLAPLLALGLALTSIAIIPFGPEPLRLFGHDIYLGIAPPNLNIGILALFAITALGVYGVALAGWASNSKYPLLGGLRSSAQMVSYELTLTMSVVGVLLMAGSFNLRDIINAQAPLAGDPDHGMIAWNIWPQFLGFFCFFTAAVAETNRVPFDLPEAEQELVAGFNTEYASFKFAMFFIAEYTSMITVSCLCTIMFFGGWLSPFPASWTLTHYLPSVILIPFGLWVILDGFRYETTLGRLVLPAVGTVITALGLAFIVFPQVNAFIQAPFWFISKVLLFLFVYVWMRGTLPRFRYDQLMAFGWKLLLPVSIINVAITSFVILAKMQWGAK
ncbi:MAG: NADH-quinone oxidoreductase subunit NuoH [Acidobacteria bacterium Pan2503]|uniref:NADH-quinone oxidoreductase subunit H n=1 Tax=Candidatus Acidiferrum panamense TaxID=2741543 RepID=A0A7V8NN40_9BACT|nr:NADH-quinone oxidoreductase subunit NuoH [Candidatus Acidoferrum panamensis]